tara:strand:- start:3047 stop:4732 length:1686 start_codon:yes stop_codon:yes gene_type:complete
MRQLLLTLLLVPALALGQSSGDGIDVSLEFRGTTAGENDITKVQVNDTLVFGLEITDLNPDHDVTYIHTDVEYNKNAYTLLDPVWKVSGANNNLFFYDNTKWNPNTNYDLNDLWAQWSGGGGNYASTSGWSVGHWTSQYTSAFAGDYVELHFIAKTTDAANFTKGINVTMAKVTDNNTGHTYPIGKVRGHETQFISNVPLEDFDNNVYIKVETSSNVDATKIKATLGKGANNETIATVNLDANGEANVTDYFNSSSETYHITFDWDGTEEEWQQLKDDAITISDAVLILKETGGFEHGDTGNAYEHPIQYVATDFNVDGVINDQDSFDLLGHVLDVLDVFTKYIEDQFTSGFALVPSAIYNALTLQNWTDQDLPDMGDGGFTLDLSNGDINLAYKSALWGDANLSHGTVQDNAAGSGVTYSIANSSPLTSKSMTQYAVSDSTVEATLVTEIKDNGEVHVEFEILSEDTAALQLKVNYDATRLQFKEVVFDTGNTTTNFGNADYAIVNMGSVNQNGDPLPQNSKMTIVFDPLETITSAAGLVSIRNTDAASTEGLQQHLNIQ